MRFLLDTDICSAHLRAVNAVSTKMQQHGGQLQISMVTLGELFAWSLRRRTARKYTVALQELFRDVAVLEIDTNVAKTFGAIHASLLDVVRPAPVLDLWIAATAITHSLTLVTHNTRDFANVPGLTVVDWLAS